MAKNKSNKKQGGNMSPDKIVNPAEIDVADTEETVENNETEETSEEKDAEGVKDGVDPEIPTEEEVEDTEPLKVPVTDDADVIQLYKLMNDYIKNIQLGAGTNRTEENIIKFVNIGKFIAKRNRTKLIEVFYTEIVAGVRSNLMAPDLVFQFINKVNDDQKRNIETLYTSLLALRDYLEKPKAKVGFPLDLKKIEQAFGGNSISVFIKKFIG